ncbi:MAG: acyl-CoA dehydratase activase [Gemmatimonadota bacterium]
MRIADSGLAAGVDAGTECVKAVIVTDAGQVLGRAVVPTRGYFQACVVEVLAAALDDAQRSESELVGLGATGFASEAVPGATLVATETGCHARGAFHHLGHAMTLVDIGGRDPHVITVDDMGRRVEARNLRRCAIGVGSFLMFTARHLDVSATGLQALAAAAAQPARVSSYCSVFSTSEVLERLREGASREEIALGSMHSIAERIAEIGGFTEPVVVCGGVAEYFPGVLHALSLLTGLPIATVPEPILTGALGAAMKVHQQMAGASGRTAVAG